MILRKKTLIDVNRGLVQQKTARRGQGLNSWTSSTLRRESTRVRNVAFMPRAVQSNSLCLAPPPSPPPAVILHGWFLALSLSDLSPQQQRDEPSRRHSQVHMTRPQRIRPRRRYHNHLQPRHCSTLIKLQRTHPARPECRLLCPGSEEYRPSNASHFTEDESRICGSPSQEDHNIWLNERKLNWYFYYQEGKKNWFLIF